MTGVDDPRSSGLGSWRDEKDLSFDEVRDRIGDDVCELDEKGERIATLMVHDANLGRTALARGCTDLVLAGHLHTQVGPTRVVGENGKVGYTYTNGTTGGAAYAIALGKIRRDAEFTFVTYRDGRPVGIQPVTVSDDGRARRGAVHPARPRLRPVSSADLPWGHRRRPRPARGHAAGRWCGVRRRRARRSAAEPTPRRRPGPRRAHPFADRVRALPDAPTDDRREPATRAAPVVHVDPCARGCATSRSSATAAARTTGRGRDPERRGDGLTPRARAEASAPAWSATSSSPATGPPTPHPWPTCPTLETGDRVVVRSGDRELVYRITRHPLDVVPLAAVARRANEPRCPGRPGRRADPGDAHPLHLRHPGGPRRRQLLVRRVRQPRAPDRQDRRAGAGATGPAGPSRCACAGTDWVTYESSRRRTRPGGSRRCSSVGRAPPL